MDYLNTYLPKSSNVVSINYRDHDPGVAAAIANAYALALIQNGIMSQFNSTACSRDYLDRQLKLAKERLEQSERALDLDRVYLQPGRYVVALWLAAANESTLDYRPMALSIELVDPRAGRADGDMPPQRDGLVPCEARVSGVLGVMA